MLFKGDDNTKYFQLLANGRHRKIKIFQLEQDEGVIVGDENLKTYITNFYKNHLHHQTVIIFSSQISDIENDLLKATYREEDIRVAILEMKHNKAPGPDGFPAVFIKAFGMLLSLIF